MDFLAVISLGTYPTPTPTSIARAAYASSYGFLGLLATPISNFFTSEGIGKLKMGMKMT